MNVGFENIVTNIGVSFEMTVTLIVICCGIVFYAKDVKLGILLHFIAMGCVFMWFYAANYNYIPPLVLFFMFLILLSFTLYATSKSSARGAFI